MPREPLELEIGQLAINACDLLERLMHELSEDFEHRAGTDRFSAYREPAMRARRVAMHCCGLRRVMRHYTNSTSWLLKEQRVDSASVDGDLDF